MNQLALIARAAGIRQTDLLALAPANDPFALYQPARRRNAQWFAELWHNFGFGHVRRKIEAEVSAAQGRVAQSLRASAEFLEKGGELAYSDAADEP